MSITKTQFVGLLITVLCACMIVQAWTVYRLSDLGATQHSLCRLVNAANTGADATRLRIRQSADRNRRIAQIDVANARIARSISTRQRPFAKGWRKLAEIARETADDFDRQADRVKPVHLTGC